MMKLLKWVVGVLVVAGLGGGTLLLGYVLDWPLPWVGAALAGTAGCAGLIVGVLRWRSRRAARPAAAPETPATARGRDLAGCWKQCVQTLRQARVKGGLDPVGEAPWYLVLGPPGSGKTAVLAQGGGVAGEAVAAAAGFGWRLLEQGVVLDTPGRYAVPGTAEDGEEWQALLALLHRTRKHAPLNGVVLTVAAPTLLQVESPERAALGTALAKRLDELAAALGVVVPVYLLVTQCDRISGMVPFFEGFPVVVRDQVWGGLSDATAAEASVAAFGERVCTQTYQRLRELRLARLGEDQAEPLAPTAYLFPEEFRALGAPLAELLGVVFAASPYREPPFCRGLYFCSALQEGVPVSRFLPGLGLQAEQRAPTPSAHSWFLRDFYTAVLARDQSLVTPTTKAVGWDRLVRTLGVSAWGVVCAVVGVLLSLTFVQDLRTIRVVADELPTSPFLGQEFAANQVMLHQLRGAVETARARDGARWLPRLGLNQSRRLLRQLESVYCGRFALGILEPLDAELDRSLEQVATAGAPPEVARYVDFMSRRAGLLQRATAADAAPEALAEAPLPAFALVLARLPGGLTGDAAEAVIGDYLAYLRWQPEPPVLVSALAAERARMQGFLAHRAIGFTWLKDWANLQTDLEAVSAVPYWGEEVTRPDGSPLEVERAFTPEGWEKIHRFTGEIQESLAGGAEVQAALEQFQTAYRDEYLLQWKDFLAGFPRGFRRWVARSRQVDLAGKLAAPDSPYALLLAAVPEAVAPAVELTGGDESLAAWVPLVYDLQRLADPAYQQDLAGGEGVLGRWTAKGGKALGDLKTRLRGETDEQKLEKRDRSAYPYLTAYQESLRQSAAQVLSPRAAHQLVRATYLEAEALVGEPKQAVNRNAWALTQLRGMLSSGSPQEKVVWNLFERPLEQVWSVLLEQTQGDLDEQWQTKVLAEGKGLSGWDLVEVLQGPTGKVWSFQEEVLAPFLTKKRSRGYQARALYSHSLAFAPPLLKLLTRGRLSGKALKGEYRVQVAALPTDANAGASQQPHRTSLILQCADGPQSLVNLNYPIRKTLVWSPGACSEVDVEIALGEVVLSRTYKGYDAFIQFLSEFRRGSRNFERGAFPDQQALLSGYGVDHLTVRYSFEGAGKVLALAGYRPGQVPARLFP